jgi:hypothetical protein
MRTGATRIVVYLPTGRVALRLKTMPNAAIYGKEKSLAGGGRQRLVPICV